MLSGRKIEFGLVLSAVIGLLFSITPFFAGEKLKNSSLLTEGVGTCFTRVQQSYTAKIVGDSSSEYLRSSFFSDTEDCFGEVLGISKRTSIFSDYKAGLVGLNNLVSDVHWFHQGLKGTVGFNSGDDARKVAEKYGKLESARFTVEEALGALRKQAVSNFKYFKAFTIASIVAFAFFTTLAIFRRRKVIAEFDAIETRAKKMIEEGRFGDFQELGNLVENYCAGLNLGYGQRVIRTLVDMGQNKAIELLPSTTKGQLEKAPNNLVMFQVNERPLDEQQIDKIWSEMQEKDADQTPVFTSENELVPEMTPEVEGYQVDEILARVIDQLTPRLFKDGLMLEMDSDNLLRTNLDIDLLEQVFLEMLSLSLHQDTQKNAYNLSVRSYQDENAKYFIVLGPAVGIENVSSFKIVQELCREITGKFQFTPVTSSNGTEIGCRLELIYDSTIKPQLQTETTPRQEQRRLTSIKKGKKKDLVLT